MFSAVVWVHGRALVPRVPRVAPQLCSLRTFESMRNDSNVVGGHDGRSREHVGLGGDYVGQVIVVQIGCAIVTQVVKSPLVSKNKGMRPRSTLGNTYRGWSTHGQSDE